MDKPGGIIDCVPDEKQDDGTMDCTIDLTEDDTSQPVGKIDRAPDVLHINTVPANVVARNGARPSAGRVLHEEYEKQEDQNEQANRWYPGWKTGGRAWEKNRPCPWWGTRRKNDGLYHWFYTQDGEIDSAPDEKQDEGTIQPVGALDDSLDVKQEENTAQPDGTIGSIHSKKQEDQTIQPAGTFDDTPDVKQGEETDEPCGKVGSGPDQKQEDQPIQVARRTDPGGEQSDEAAQPDRKIDQSGAVESNSIHVKEKWKVTLSSPKSPRLEKIIWNTSLPVHPETTDGKTNPGGEEDDVADHPDRKMDELESAVTQFELTSTQIKEKWKVTLSSPRLSWSGEIILNTSSPVHHETTKNTKQCEHITPNVTPKVKSPIQNQDVQTSSNLTCASKEKGFPKAVPPCMVVKNSEQHDLLTLQSNLLIPMPDGTMRRLKVIQMKNMSNKPLGGVSKTIMSS